jgi:hypothetical protein
MLTAGHFRNVGTLIPPLYDFYPDGYPGVGRLEAPTNPRLTDTRETRIAGVLHWVFLLLLLAGMIAEQFKER